MIAVDGIRVIGRDAELAACHRLLHSGQRRSGILIAGEPGMGKTLLHRALIDMGHEANQRVLFTTGLANEVTVPLANLADLLEPEVETVLGQLPAPHAVALRAALRLAPATDPSDFAVIARATMRALRALADRRLLIAIDDEQWLDPDTRRLLSSVLAWLTDLPVTWAVSVRAADAEHGLGQVLAHEFGTHLVRLSLRTMDADSLAELIRERFPVPWPPHVLRKIVELGHGNPYAVLEIARHTVMIEGREAHGAHLPASVTESLRARLASLDADTMAIAQLASLTPAPTRMLLRRVRADTADAAIDDALRHDVLRLNPPDPVLRFSHPLLREVALTSMSALERRRSHHALAAVVEDADEAAGHLAAGAEEPDDELAEVVIAASKRMLAQGAPGRGAELAESAVALTPDRDGLPAWRRRLVHLERLEEACEWGRARELADRWGAAVPTELRGDLTALRAESAIDFDARRELSLQAARELTSNPARAAGIYVSLASDVGISMLRLGEGIGYAREAVRLALESDDRVVMRIAVGWEAALSHFAGDPAAGARLRAAVALPGLADMNKPYAGPETGLGWYHLGRGEVNDARTLFHAVSEAAERRGAEDSAAGAHLHLAEVEWRAGRWDELARHAAAYERYERETGAGQVGVHTYVNALHAAAVGKVDLARATAAAGVRAAEAQQDWTFAAQCRFVLGHLALSLDDPAAAVDWLDPIGAVLHDHGFVDTGPIAFPPDLIEAYARVGRIDDALRNLGWLRDTAERLDHPWARITAGRAAAVVCMARRESAAAIEPATVAVTEARDMSLPVELGRCLLVLGTAQRRARRRRDAARTLDEAIDLFTAVGAPCWQALAQSQRAHLSQGSGQDLTPAEQRVAQLVAQGLTNTEIAASMQISVKTVEANLTRIYRKLGIRGRVDLATNPRPAH